MASEMEKNVASILESVNFIKDHVETIEERLDGIEGRLENVETTLSEHTKTLADHTCRLTGIEEDVKQNLDKRLNLEVRVTRLEEHTGLEPLVQA